MESKLLTVNRNHMKLTPKQASTFQDGTVPYAPILFDSLSMCDRKARRSREVKLSEYLTSAISWANLSHTHNGRLSESAHFHKAEGGRRHQGRSLLSTIHCPHFAESTTSVVAVLPCLCCRCCCWDCRCFFFCSLTVLLVVDRTRNRFRKDCAR